MTPHNESLADRVRVAIGDPPGLSEQKMVGGVGFLVEDTMFLGVVKDELMVRVGHDGHAEAAALPHTRSMDVAGQPMLGYVFVAPAGCTKLEQVAFWAKWSLAHARTLLAADAEATAKRKVARRAAIAKSARAGAGVVVARVKPKRAPKPVAPKRSKQA